MKRVFITGICGFVGSNLARNFQDSWEEVEIFGVDNLLRAGAHLNRAELQGRGIRCWHGDLRVASDLEQVPKADWVIDAAANPNVTAGIDGVTSSRQLLEHNLCGTINVLE